jgi:hypothetical protein
VVKNMGADGGGGLHLCGEKYSEQTEGRATPL